LVPWVAPVTVVQDSGDFVALFLDIGARYRRPGDADGNPTRDYTHSSASIEATWTDHRALHLIRSGGSHSTVAMWDAAGRFVCWYINFQQPSRRTPLGFDTLDFTLDLVIQPNRVDWHWKDEDEFEHGIQAGWYERSQLDNLKAYGLSIVEKAHAGEPPFADGWEQWRPDPGWTIPTLPAQWEVV
jgi:hypothetical protein